MHKSKSQAALTMFQNKFHKRSHKYSTNFSTSDYSILPFKGTLLGLRQFLATESPLKLMKNACYFHLNSSFCSQDI